jgi:hypothetical protein
MPTYRIKTDQGEFDIEADREPTQEEVMQAMGAQQAAPQQAAPAMQPEQPSPTFMQRLGKAVQSAGGEGFQQTGMEAPPPTQAERDVYYPALAKGMRTGAATAAMVAPMAVTGAGLPLAMGIGARAIAGGAGYLANRGIEGETPKLSELAQTMILTGPGVPKGAPAGFFSGQGMMNAAKGGTAATATVAGANYAEQAIDQGTADIAWDKYKTSLKDAVVPAIIGASALSLGGKLQSMQKIQAEADAGRAAAAELGMTDPMLGDVLPKRYGAMQQKIVSIDPSMLAKQNAARAPMARAIFATAMDAPQNEQIAAQLQPIIRVTDEADAAYQAAQQRMGQAQEVMAKAKAATNLDPTARADILKGAIAETHKGISEQAKAGIALMVGADTIGTQTGHAEAVQDVTKKLFGARSQAAGELLAATGIPDNAAIIGQDALYNAAKAALGADAELTAGKSILETIKNWGSKTAQDAVATKQLSLEQMARKAALEGRELTQAEVAANLSPKGTLFRNGQPVTPAVQSAAATTAPEEKFLTLDDFRRLRDAISDGFQGKIDTNNMNNAERLAAKTYHAMSDAHVSEIGRMFPDAVEPYQKFRKFWAETSQLRDSDFGRALLRGEVADSTVAGMADKLASGNVDEIKNFRKFVSLIEPMNKDVADLAMTTMGSAVRNSFLEKATDAYGVDYRKLGELVGRYSAKKDSPFPVELFRMGDASTIKGWTKALQEFKPHELTPETIRSVMESPQIQQVLNVGGKDAPAQVAKAMATVAFTKRVNDAVALREAGLVKKAREAFVEANGLAKRAGVDAQAAQVAMQAAENNPLTSVFKTKGNYSLTNVAEKIDGAGTVTDLVANMRRSESRAFMDALRKDKPDLADMVERRLTANALQGMTRAEKNVPGQIMNIDTQKVRNFFEGPPGMDADTKFSQLKAAIGEEKAERLRKFASGVAKMDDASRTSMIKAGLPNEVVAAAEFARTGQSGSIQSGRSLGSLIRQGNNMLRTSKFNLASEILLNDGAWNAFSRNSGNYAAALAELPPQRAYMLLQDARIMNELGQKQNDSPR